MYCLTPKMSEPPEGTLPQSITFLNKKYFICEMQFASFCHLFFLFVLLYFVSLFLSILELKTNSLDSVKEISFPFCFIRSLVLQVMRRKNEGCGGVPSSGDDAEKRPMKKEGTNQL